MKFLLFILVSCGLVGCTVDLNIRSCGDACLKQGKTMDYYEGGGTSGKCQCK